MEWKCLNCNKKHYDYPYLAKKRKYCNSKCQMYYEYKTGKRDKFKNGIKAREVSNKKIKENNWLNSKKSRKKLIEIMQTKEYKEKQRISKTGSKNGMYGKTPWNKLPITKKWWKEKKFIKLRKLCLVRDNFKCVKCKVSQKEKNLYCDHIIPYRICKKHEFHNLQMLCASCHSKKTVIDCKQYNLFNFKP